jgi:hypothetical protein
MKAHVANICFKRFIRFRGMLQLFHVDVANVDRGCCTCCICCKCLRSMLQVFQRFVQNVSSIPVVCCKRSDLNVAYVSHICCNNMFQIFQLFQSYVAVIVFMLQVTNILFGCCICFTYMLEVYVADVFICCICMLHSSVLCCTSFMLFEKLGAQGVMVAWREH